MDPDPYVLKEIELQGYASQPVVSYYMKCQESMEDPFNDDVNDALLAIKDVIQDHILISDAALTHYPQNQVCVHLNALEFLHIKTCHGLGNLKGLKAVTRGFLIFYFPVSTTVNNSESVGLDCECYTESHRTPCPAAELSSICQCLQASIECWMQWVDVSSLLVESLQKNAICSTSSGDFY